VHKDKLRVMVRSREWVSFANAKDSKWALAFWEECASNAMDNNDYKYTL